MKLAGKVTIVTGGASGIGAALAERFVAEGAAVVIGDLDGAGAERLAVRLGDAAVAMTADVTKQDDLASLIGLAEERFGAVDVFCSNAGIGIGGGPEVSDDDWQLIWAVNVHAHVLAARLMVPKMLASGGGYLLNTASAAGLLSQIGSAPYAVTKHAAVAFAEWLSITYGSQGLKVSVLCPQAVNTPMIAGTETGGVAGVDGVLEPSDVAASVVEGMADERFLILPHPVVLDYLQRKTADYDRWLGGMRRLASRFGSPF